MVSLTILMCPSREIIWTYLNYCLEVVEINQNVSHENRIQSHISPQSHHHITSYQSFLVSLLHLENDLGPARNAVAGAELSSDTMDGGFSSFRRSLELGTHMGLSIHGGTPKSSILMGFSIINHPFRGYPHLWKPPYPHIGFPNSPCIWEGDFDHETVAR